MKRFIQHLYDKNGLLKEKYGELVNIFLRQQYSLSEELSILRKRDEDPEQFAAYNAYAEECKAKARAEIYGEE